MEINGSVEHRLNELAQLTESNIMSLNGDIGPESFVEVVAHLDNMDKLEDFTLVLNSNGGFIEFAFRIAKAIRGKCDSLTFLVPIRAKSAATLLALASE
jgi:ATP-dependent protease ClpP protease subunit